MKIEIANMMLAVMVFTVKLLSKNTGVPFCLKLHWTIACYQCLLLPPYLFFIICFARASWTDFYVDIIIKVDQFTMLPIEVMGESIYKFFS